MFENEMHKRGTEYRQTETRLWWKLVSTKMVQTGGAVAAAIPSVSNRGWGTH